MSFWGELRRRNVVKVGVAYLIVAWLIVQVVSAINEPMGLPDWVDGTVLVFLAVGFPLAILFTWAFEITPQGIKKTHHVPLEESITHLTGQKLNYIVTGLLAVALGFVIVDQYLLVAPSEPIAEPQAGVESTAASIETRESPDQSSGIMPNSVAVIPFTNLSPNEEDAYFAAGIHEEILNQLVKLRSLNVIARTSVMQYANTQKTIPEIGRELNVESVMEGSVRYADGQVLVTTQLIDATSSVHLWSESYRRDFSNIFEIQADIAMNVANALEAEFTGVEQELIARPQTESLEAYELYLAARAQLGSLSLDDALDSIDGALALDADFALAWATKSSIHSFLAQNVSADRYEAERDAILNAALRAVEIDPGLSEGHVMLATARGQRGNWRAAEEGYRRAYELSRNDLTAYRYALHSLAVGKIEEARELFGVARQSNPLDANTRWFYALTLALLGETSLANEEFERGSNLFGAGGLRNWFMTLSRLGSDEYASTDEIPAFNEIQNEARGFLRSPEDGLAAVRDAYTDDEGLTTGALLTIAIWSAYFGDSNLALDAMEELTNRNAQNVFNVWVPSMRSARQSPRFKALLQEIGLIDHWNDFGWPSMCRPLDDGEFECR